jgi:hypothetical protein
MRRPILIAIAAIATLALAGSAAAAVVVYKNSFNNRADYTSIKRLSGGKKCDKAWKKKKMLGLKTSSGRRNCSFDTPVEGDSKQPNHIIQASAKIGKATHRKIREKVYVGVALRANERSEYELRIFSKGRRWQLLKNGQVVGSGKEPAIEAIGKANKLRLAADGPRAVAKVNGKALTTFRDQDPEEVSGRKTAVTFGSTAKPKRDAAATFSAVKVLVPSP